MEEILANEEDCIGGHQDHGDLNHGIVEDLADPQNGHHTDEDADQAAPRPDLAETDYGTTHGEYAGSENRGA